MPTPELTTTTTTTTMLQGEEDEEIDHVQHERSRSIRPNPIAALIRQGAEEAGRLQGGSRATTKVQRMINSLRWRQVRESYWLSPTAPSNPLQPSKPSHLCAYRSSSLLAL